MVNVVKWSNKLPTVCCNCPKKKEAELSRWPAVPAGHARKGMHCARKRILFRNLLCTYISGCHFSLLVDVASLQAREQVLFIRSSMPPGCLEAKSKLKWLVPFFFSSSHQWRHVRRRAEFAAGEVSSVARTEEFSINTDQASTYKFSLSSHYVRVCMYTCTVCVLGMAQHNLLCTHRKCTTTPQSKNVYDFFDDWHPLLVSQEGIFQTQTQSTSIRLVVFVVFMQFMGNVLKNNNIYSNNSRRKT